jgi:hypothetical protein
VPSLMPSRPTKAEMLPFVRRLLWGAKWGFIFGAILAGLATLVRIIAGSEEFSRMNTTISSVVVAYVSGCVAAGLIVGAMKPLARTKAGAGVTGFIAGLPISWFVATTTSGAGATRWHNVALCLMTALLLCVPVGLMYREIFNEKSDRA